MMRCVKKEIDLMLASFFRHTFTLQMEIVAMVAEEIQQRAESYVQNHSDETYEAYLNDMINQVEKTVDLVAAPFENLMQSLNQLQSKTHPLPNLGLNWNEAFETLQARIQDLKKNLPS